MKMGLYKLMIKGENPAKGHEIIYSLRENDYSPLPQQAKPFIL